MRESAIEKTLKKAIDKIPNVLQRKNNPQWDKGVPDRLILLPHGKVIWVELKAPNKTLRATQKLYKSKLERIGHIVVVVDSLEDVKKLIETIKEIIKNG